LQRRGISAGKRVGGRQNTEQAEPVFKGNHGSDEGDPKPPSVSEKKTGQRRAGLEKRVDVNGDEQKEILRVLMSSARMKRPDGCATNRLDCTI
jgi:hypothetical protein